MDATHESRCETHGFFLNAPCEDKRKRRNSFNKTEKFGSQPLVERRVIYTTTDRLGFRLDPVAFLNCQSA